MSKHTPGPWAVCNLSDIFTQNGAANASGMKCDSNDGWQIADCAVGVTTVNGELVEMPYDEIRANATLIAAAPELLVALTEIAALEGSEENEWDAVERLIPIIAAIARAAIAKAGGAK